PRDVYAAMLLALIWIVEHEPGDERCDIIDVLRPYLTWDLRNPSCRRRAPPPLSINEAISAIRGLLYVNWVEHPNDANRVDELLEPVALLVDDAIAFIGANLGQPKLHPLALNDAFRLHWRSDFHWPPSSVDESLRVN